MFHRVGVEGSGSVAVEERLFRQRSIRLMEIDLGVKAAAEVLLIAATDAWDDGTARDTLHVALGSLAAGERDLRLAIPDCVDLKRYQAVVLWSGNGGGNLMTAPLVRQGWKF